MVFSEQTADQSTAQKRASTTALASENNN